MTTIGYRIAQGSDAQSMARIRAADWGTVEFWSARISGYMSGEHNPQKALAPRICFAAVVGDMAAGFIAGHLTRRHDCDGELQWISVAESHRGTGIAAELLRLLAIWFSEQNALKVCVDVEPENTVARRFYAKHGAEALNDHWFVWKNIRDVLRRSV